MTSPLFPADKEFFRHPFEGLDVASEIIRERTFENCVFTKCVMSDTAFERCRFIECVFSNCDLSNTSFQFSMLRSVVFEDSKVIGIDWTRAQWSRQSSAGDLTFRSCLLNYSSFYGLHLPGLAIEACQARFVDFREGDFSKGNFGGSDLTESQFQNTKLDEVDLTETDGVNLDIRQNSLRRARLSRYVAADLLQGFDIAWVD